MNTKKLIVRNKKLRSQVAQLKIQLEAALKEQDYLKASEYRDEIKVIEGILAQP